LLQLEHPRSSVFKLSPCTEMPLVRFFVDCGELAGNTSS
jgi:hypothetical protein